MAKVGLTQAVELTGKAASTITRRTVHKNIKKRLSFTLNDGGEKQYDVAELERVFGKLNTPQENKNANENALVQKPEIASARNDLQQQIKEAHDANSALLHDKIALLQTQLDEIRKDRDEWREQAKQNTRLLENHAKEKEQTAEEGRGFFSKIFSGK